MGLGLHGATGLHDRYGKQFQVWAGSTTDPRHMGKKSQVLPNFFDRDHSQQTRDSVTDEHLLTCFLIFQLCG